MPAYEAYGQTDVMSDPRALMMQAQGHGRQARFARERLKQLQDERQFQAGHRQQAEQFAAAHAQQERQRQDALTEGGRRHDETLGQQKLAQQQLEAYRQAQLSQSEEGRRFQRSTGLLNLAQSYDPSITPEMKKKLYDMYLQSITDGGGQPATAGQPQAPATGQTQTQTAAPATGATPSATGLSSLVPQTADPKAAKVAAFQAGQGSAMAPTAQQGTTPPETQPGTIAPSSFVIPQGARETLDPHGTPRTDAYDTVNPDGTTTTHFAAGGSSTAFKPNTTQGVAKTNDARSQGAARGEYLDAHPTGTGLEYSGGNYPSSRSDIPSNIRSNNFVPATLAAQPGAGSTPPMDVATVPPPGAIQGPPMEGQREAGVAGFSPSELAAGPQAPAPAGPAPAPQAPPPVAAAPAAAGPVRPEQIPTNAAGEPQYPSGAMSSGLHSGAWLADQFKQLPIQFNPAGHPAEDYQAAEQRRRLQTTGY